MHSPFLSSNRTNRVWTLSPNWSFSLITLLCIHLAYQAVTGAYLFVLKKILQFSSDRQNCRARIGFLLLNLLCRLSYCQRLSFNVLVFNGVHAKMLYCTLWQSTMNSKESIKPTVFFWGGERGLLAILYSPSLFL